MQVSYDLKKEPCLHWTIQVRSCELIDRGNACSRMIDGESLPAFGNALVKGSKGKGEMGKSQSGHVGLPSRLASSG